MATFCHRRVMYSVLMIKLLRTTLSAFSIALCCCANALASELKPYVAEYEAKISGFNVNLHRQLVRDGAHYTLSMNLQKLWLGIEEQCVFAIDPNGIVKTATYSHIRSGVSKKHNTDLRFDWNTRQVTDRLINSHEPLSVEFPTYDKLSFQPQFRLDLISKPLQKRYEYRLASNKRVKLYAYDFVAEETIDTPLGKLRTLKFQRDFGAKQRQDFIWFAKDWDYLIARIDHLDEPGDKPDRTLLNSATIDGKQVVGLQ